jgi:hypothetical protein
MHAPNHVQYPVTTHAFPCHALVNPRLLACKKLVKTRLAVPLRTLGVPVHPVLRILVKGSSVALELVRNTRLDRVIRLRSSEDCPDQREHVLDLVWWLPLLRAQHTQAHGAAVVVRHIGVVDLGFEADARRLEGVVFGKSDVELEVTALVGLLVLLDV